MIDLILEIVVILVLLRLTRTLKEAVDALAPPPDGSQPYDYTQHDRDRPRSHLYETNKDPRLPE